MRYSEAALAAPANSLVLPASPAGLLDRLKGGGVFRWIGAAITLAILAAVLWRLRELPLAQVIADIPAKPVFWLLFTAYYFAAPLADWIIFRRLWSIPVAGFVALTRKLIGNELLLGYSGELYFYSWARARADLPNAPFAAIRDVAILSALAGNLTTLAMLGAAYPAVGLLDLGIGMRSAAISIGIIMATSLIVMLFRRRLFGLGREDVIFVAAVHLARIIATTGLAALMWHVVLPGQPVELWLLLATLRLLLSRLPLLPNKELVFAGIAVLVMGHDLQIGTMMTMIATLILTAHLMVGALLSATEISGWWRR